MSYDDQEAFRLFGVQYKATKDQANAIWREMLGTPEQQRFEVVDSMLNFGTWDVHALSSSAGSWEKFRELCYERADLEVRLFDIATKIIEKHTG